MVEKAKKTPFKPLVKTQKQKEIEVVPEDIFGTVLYDGFSPGLSAEGIQDNGLPWSVRLISVTSIGQTIIALGDDRRLYRWTKGQWVAR